MTNTYYEFLNVTMFELRQTRFRNNVNIPHDVCAVARTHAELVSMYNQYLSGGVDWLVEEGETYIDRIVGGSVKLISFNEDDDLVVIEHPDGKRNEMTPFDFLAFYRRQA